MENSLVPIIQESVLQILAQRNKIPSQITKSQYDTVSNTIEQCIQFVSRSQDYTSGVDFQRRVTMMALNSIPAIFQQTQDTIEETPRNEITLDLPKLDDLVEIEMAKRKQQDQELGVSEAVGVMLDQEPEPENEPSQIPRPLDLADNLPPMIPAGTITPVAQPASYPASQLDTVAIPHDVMNVAPLEIRYIALNPVTQIQKLILPKWINSTNAPFIVCKVSNRNIYLFAESEGSSIYIPQPHAMLPKQTEYTFTFHTPDGQALTTELPEYPDIPEYVSGVKIRRAENDTFDDKVYSPLDEDLRTSDVASCCAVLKSEWDITLFVTTMIEDL